MHTIHIGYFDVCSNHPLPLQDWNHFDFLIGKDTDIYVNNVLVNMLLKHENEELMGQKTQPPNDANGQKTSNQSEAVKLTMYDTRTCSISNKCFLL